MSLQAFPQSLANFSQFLTASSLENLPVMLEAVMIVCFGLSWPLSIAKAYRARTAKGSSIFFMSFIQLGYGAGIVAKILKGVWDWVHILSFSFYIINFCMVAIGIALYFRGKHHDALNSHLPTPTNPAKN